MTAPLKKHFLSEKETGYAIQLASRLEAAQSQQNEADCCHRRRRRRGAADARAARVS